MTVEACPFCGRYRTSCPPQWLVQIHDWHDFDRDDGIKICAIDAETAAQEGIEKWDGERVVLDDAKLVRVVRSGVHARSNGAPEWFVVSAMATIIYTADEAGPPEDET